MKCAPGCQAIVSSRGMMTQRDDRTERDVFAFVVEPTASGWRASTISGTSWTHVSLDCGSDSCFGKIDTNGISKR